MHSTFDRRMQARDPRKASSFGGWDCFDHRGSTYTSRSAGRAFAPLASFAMFHLVTVFPLSWIFLYSRQPIGQFLWLEIVGGVVGLITVAISGFCSI